MAAAGLRWIVDIMNHGEAWPSAYVQKPALWAEAKYNVANAVVSPSYLRICGRPVVLVGNGFDLVTQAGGRAAAVTLMEELRAAILATGQQEPIFGSGFLPAGKQHDSTAAFVQEFGLQYDFTNNYGAFWYPTDERGTNVQPPVTQPELRTNQALIRQRHATSPAQIPHVPSFPMGFHPVMECSCWGRLTALQRAQWWIPTQYWGCKTERTIAVPTPAEFKVALQELWDSLVTEPVFGISTGNGTYRSQPVATIYAWNELTESYPCLVPQNGTGYTLLQVVKDVFAPANVADKVCALHTVIGKCLSSGRCQWTGGACIPLPPGSPPSPPPQCSSGKYLLSHPSTSAVTCKTCATCGTGKYKSGGCSGSSDTVCSTCSNTNCATGQYRTGSCSGTINGFSCSTCATCGK